MIETKIYVGLNDSVTLTQLFNDDRYITVLKHVCSNYHVPFSFSIIECGYCYESGEFINQKALAITLIDVDEKIVDEIAKDLCVFFHQKSVVISFSETRAKLIKESLE